MPSESIELESRGTEPAPLKTILHLVQAHVLLIASNRADERTMDEAFRARIRQTSLWYLPDAGHADGLRSHPEAYAARVTAFLL
jgi:hypothetical protein